MNVQKIQKMQKINTSLNDFEFEDFENVDFEDVDIFLTEGKSVEMNMKINTAMEGKSVKINFA